MGKDATKRNMANRMNNQIAGMNGVIGKLARRRVSPAEFWHEVETVYTKPRSVKHGIPKQ